MFGGFKTGWLMWPWKGITARGIELTQGPPVQRTQETSRNPRILKDQRNTDQNHEWFSFSREKQKQEAGPPGS